MGRRPPRSPLFPSTTLFRSTGEAGKKMKKVGIIGCGAIGSLYAAHLARVAEVWAFVRREDHALALNRDGLRVTGTHELSVALKATTKPKELPDFDFGIVATKATQEIGNAVGIRSPA